jgi:hypothetical protein
MLVRFKLHIAHGFQPWVRKYSIDRQNRFNGLNCSYVVSAAFQRSDRITSWTKSNDLYDFDFPGIFFDLFKFIFRKKKSRQSCVSPLFGLDTIYIEFAHCPQHALHVVTLCWKAFMKNCSSFS